MINDNVRDAVGSTAPQFYQKWVAINHQNIWVVYDIAVLTVVIFTTVVVFEYHFLPLLESYNFDKPSLILNIPTSTLGSH